MNQSSTEEDIEKVKEKAIQQGHEPLVIYGVERSVVAVSGMVNDDHRAVMKLLPNVSRVIPCLLYTSPSPRDQRGSRMPSSA